ncbi:hypothetical protein SOP87_30150, partial [Bacillus cereus]|uniref:hypothetical protein n=1 Tax=Bacillus cereus TaxID=1396 RepID=UPI002B241F53
MEKLKLEIEERTSAIEKNFSELQTVVNDIDAERLHVAGSKLQEEFTGTLEEIKSKLQTLEDTMTNLPSSDELQVIGKSVANIKIQLEAYQDFEHIQTTIATLQASLELINEEIKNIHAEARALTSIQDTLSTVQQKIEYLENLNVETNLAHFHHVLDNIQGDLESLRTSVPSSEDLEKLK